MANKRKYEISLYPIGGKDGSKPLFQDWRWAYSRRQAWFYTVRDLKKTKNLEVLHLIRIDCPASITDITDRDHGVKPGKENKKILNDIKLKSPEEEKKDYETCPKCGGDAEYDYCSSCGWQRRGQVSSWYSRMRVG